VKTGSAVAAMFACVVAGPVMAQLDDSGADNLNGSDSARCSALADLSEADRITTVFYIAGYYDGQRDAMTIATVGESAEGSARTEAQDQPAPTESDAPSAVSSADTATNRPDLAIDAILAACAQSPDSRIADIITAHLGARGE
jgi:hypothetical protein